MKKWIYLLTVGIISLQAYATYEGPSSVGQRVTVKQLLESGWDDQYVTLKGHIIKQIRPEHYIFSDGTGSIHVDIDARYMPMQAIDDKTTVEIMGEYDKEFVGPSEIDVKRVVIIKP